ncbi:MAG: hypothetical protein WBQ23_13980 [Bacteroidota bacterium]
MNLKDLPYDPDYYLADGDDLDFGIMGAEAKRLLVDLQRNVVRRSDPPDMPYDRDYNPVLLVMGVL